MKRDKHIILSFAVSAAILTLSILVRMTTSSAHADSHIVLSSNSLLASNRTDLAFCVDASQSEVNVSSEKLATLVTRALSDQIRFHPRWKELGYDRFSVNVEVDCPSEAFLLQSGASHPLLGSETIPVPNVEAPSPFRIHIYVVSQEVIDNAFHGTDLRSAPQEMLCERNQCFEVTSAVYLTPNDVSNLQTVKDRIERVLALNLVDVTGVTNESN